MASAKGYNQLEGCNLNKLDDWNRLEDLLEQDNTSEYLTKTLIKTKVSTNVHQRCMN